MDIRQPDRPSWDEFRRERAWLGAPREGGAYLTMTGVGELPVQGKQELRQIVGCVPMGFCVVWPHRWVLDWVDNLGGRGQPLNGLEDCRGGTRKVVS